MAWPTPQDYNEAIQNPRLCFADADLRDAAPELTALGLPRPITGNFASVYHMRGNGRDWAVRCFWREFEDLHERYQAISRHLQVANLPYTVGFQYEERGIRVRGGWYPILKMEWVEGKLLNEHIADHLSEPWELKKLSERWLTMARALDDAGIAHGDLQHGNVLVAGDRLQLVDYDGMYVPALRGRKSHELGHQNYQHPRRTADHFDAPLDRFSSMVVYTSLVALGQEPGLWSRLQGGDECLLFRKDDFVEGVQGRAVGALERFGDDGSRRLTRKLQSCLPLDPCHLPALDEVAMWETSRAGRFRRPFSNVFLGFPPRSPELSSSAAASSLHPLPDWVQGFREDGAPEEPAPFVAAPGHRLVARTALLLGTAPLLLGAFAGIVSLVLGACSLLFLMCAFATIISGFLRQPSVQEMRAIHRQWKSRQRALRKIEASLRGLRRAGDRGAASQLAALKSVEARKDGLKRKREARVVAIQATREDGAISIARVLAEIEALEGAVLHAALERSRANHISRALTTARVMNFGEFKRTVRLRLYCRRIRTAQDVSRRHLAALETLGGKDAARLLGWAAGSTSAAKRSAPTTLPAIDRQRASAPFQRRRKRYGQSLRRLLDREECLLRQVEAWYALELAKLEIREQRLVQSHHQQVKTIERGFSDLRQDQPLHRASADDLCRQLMRLRGVTLPRYALFLLLGVAPGG